MMQEERHEHHRAASLWWQAQDAATACWCRPVQQTVLRLLTNPQVMGVDLVTPEQAWRIWEELSLDERVAWLPLEPAGLTSTWQENIRNRAPTPKLWMDAYLAASDAHGNGATGYTLAPREPRHPCRERSRREGPRRQSPHVQRQGCRCSLRASRGTMPRLLLDRRPTPRRLARGPFPAATLRVGNADTVDGMPGIQPDSPIHRQPIHPRHSPPAPSPGQRPDIPQPRPTARVSRTPSNQGLKARHPLTGGADSDRHPVN